MRIVLIILACLFFVWVMFGLALSSLDEGMSGQSSESKGNLKIMAGLTIFLICYLLYTRKKSV